MKHDHYPKVPAMLKALNGGVLKFYILSNGSPKKLTSAIDNAGISDNLVNNYSVDKLEIHKQTPEVY